MNSTTEAVFIFCIVSLCVACFFAGWQARRVFDALDRIEHDLLEAQALLRKQTEVDE